MIALIPPPFNLIWLFGQGFIMSTVVPILKKIPWQVWLALVVVIAFFWYGHTREKRGYAACEVSYKLAANKEIIRQKTVIAEANEKSARLENELSSKATEINNAREQAVEEYRKTEKANAVCLDESITDRLRGKRR